MPDGRPLSEITAEDLNESARRAVNYLRHYAKLKKWQRLDEIADLLAELSGRLDGAVVLTREEAWEVASGNLNAVAALLCGRPGKETK